MHEMVMKNTLTANLTSNREKMKVREEVGVIDLDTQEDGIIHDNQVEINGSQE